MSTQFFHQEVVGMLPLPKPVPGDGAGIRYRRSNADLSLSHGKAVTRVSIDYMAHDASGTAEISYAYPIGTLVLVAPNRALPVEFLRAGMKFLLEDGGVARVTKVAVPQVREAPSSGKDRHGNSFGRVLGTVKYTGNFPHFDLHFDHGKIETTPGHRFWCIRRKDWIPACEFKAGDLMRSRENRPVRVRSVSGIYWRYGSLYNVEVEDFHNYFVGDLNGVSVWSHNGLPFGCRVPKAAVVEAIENGELSLRRVPKSKLHHIASDKDAEFLPAFQELFDRAAVSMQSAWNLTRIANHTGPHGKFYNQLVLDSLREATRGKNGAAFRESFLDELWALRRRTQNGDLADLLGAAAARGS